MNDGPIGATWESAVPISIDSHTYTMLLFSLFHSKLCLALLPEFIDVIRPLLLPIVLVIPSRYSSHQSCIFHSPISYADMYNCSFARNCLCTFSLKPPPIQHNTRRIGNRRETHAGTSYWHCHINVFVSSHIEQCMGWLQLL